MATIVQQPRPTRQRPASIRDDEVSRYERVASMLVSLLIMAGAAVAVLFLIWVTTQIFVPPLAMPVLLEDLGGGDPEGVLGESIFIEGPPDEEIAEETDLEEPAVQEMVAMITDVIATRQADLDDPRLTEEVETGGGGGSEGTGNARPLGEGAGGKGGVHRGMRWIILYKEGGSLDEYARQLDFFKIELGVRQGETVTYASNLSAARPNTRTGARSAEQRLLFLWDSGTLQQADRELLSRAGVQATSKVIQFFSPETENLLANLEMEYLQRKHPGRDLRTVRRTKFSVQPGAGGYVFVVVDQTYF
jgi:hypothetical protein